MYWIHVHTGTCNFFSIFYIILFMHYRMDNPCWFLDYEVDANCLDENSCTALVSFFSHPFVKVSFLLKNSASEFAECWEVTLTFVLFCVVRCGPVLRATSRQLSFCINGTQKPWRWPPKTASLLWTLLKFMAIISCTVNWTSTRLLSLMSPNPLDQWTQHSLSPHSPSPTVISLSSPALGVSTPFTSRYQILPSNSLDIWSADRASKISEESPLVKNSASEHLSIYRPTRMTEDQLELGHMNIQSERPILSLTYQWPLTIQWQEERTQCCRIIGETLCLLIWWWIQRSTNWNRSI